MQIPAPTVETDRGQESGAAINKFRVLLKTFYEERGEGDVQESRNDNVSFIKFDLIMRFKFLKLLRDLRMHPHWCIQSHQQCTIASAQ